MSARAAVRVLVAEDDATVRDALRDLITSEPGLESVGTACNAREAIQLAAAERPDVALVDVRMPEGGGALAARGIGQRSPETKVLALSADESHGAVLRMLEAGVVGYLVKGDSIDHILDSIHGAHHGQASLSIEVTGEVIDAFVEQRSSRRDEDARNRERNQRIVRALENGRGLDIVFQPIYALEDRRIVGAEALSRFSEAPERAPQEWFAEAGQAGLRGELELAAIRKALDCLPKLPPSTYLAINASPSTAAGRPFRDLLATVDTGRIVIEITEHAPVDDYDRLNAALRPVRDLGARLAIDDAGAGFASLRHILRLAPDAIKLDRSLINGIATDRSKQALAAGLISFAEKADVAIVAEGIERDRELAALRALGVPYGQGFLLARPAPPPLPDD
jgi:EAL domain-containing protein (putative c-di-GMP-specific phosphodiesterase class I)/response regulator of citrate/malate metabolism